MKHHITLILLTIVALNTQGQLSRKYELPGFVQVNDTLFVAKFETSVRDYAAFLLFLKQKKNDSLIAEHSLPDPNTTDWTIWNSYTKKLISFNSLIFEFHDTTVSFTAAMGNLPVVNISKKQAEEYCNFRSRVYEIFFDKTKNRKKKNLPSHIFFRLLTESEWKTAASFTADTSRIICTQFFEKQALAERLPASVYQGSVNDGGLFNITGNVAELVSGNDKVFGGSFKDNLQDCKATSSKYIKAGQYDVGFRIAAVVR